MYPSQSWYRRRPILLIFSLVVIAVLILSICGATRSILTTSPTDVLHKSATAMQQLKSTHFAFVISTRMIVPSSSLSYSSDPATILYPPGRAEASADVNEVLPDQSQFSLSFYDNAPNIPGTVKGGPMYTPSKLLEFAKGGQAYIQAKDNWLQLPSSLQNATNCYSFFPLTKYTNPLATLLPLVQDTNFTDHGTENIKGTNLRHITVTLGSNAFGTLADLGMVDRIF